MGSFNNKKAKTKKIKYLLESNGDYTMIKMIQWNAHLILFVHQIMQLL